MSAELDDVIVLRGLELIGVVDDFDRMLRVVDGCSPGVVDGMRMIRQKLLGLLDKNGLQAFEARSGQLFDHNLHEAVQQIEADTIPPGTIVHEATCGYTVRGRLLRPARVIVVKL